LSGYYNLLDSAIRCSRSSAPFTETARIQTLSWATWIQSTRPNPISSRSVSIWSLHVFLDLPGGLFPSVVIKSRILTREGCEARNREKCIESFDREMSWEKDHVGRSTAEPDVELKPWRFKLSKRWISIVESGSTHAAPFYTLHRWKQYCVILRAVYSLSLSSTSTAVLTPHVYIWKICLIIVWNVSWT
jgi:hypothetical protein